MTTLVLLHGLGATAAVWQPLRDHLASTWTGRIVAPDLAGHGDGPRWRRYSLGTYAAQVVAAVDRAGSDLADDDVVVLGHSMGGAVGLVLASGWFGLRPRRTVGLGIKVGWTDEELAKARELGTRPSRTFATRDEAAARWLRVSGLSGLVAPDDPMVASGVVAVDGGFGLAWDPRSAGVGVPPMRHLLDVAAGSVVLARGEHDAMVTTADLRALVPEPIEIAAAGHNAHVEDPGAVARLLAT